MQIYAFIEIILAISALVYFVYLAILWRIDSSTYDPYWLYYTGTVQTTLFIISSLAVGALGVDRCLVVKFPTKKFNFVPLVFFMISVFLWMVVNFAMRVIPAYPYHPETKMHCENFGCLLTYFQNIVYYTMRFSASGINFVVGITLAVLLKRMTILSKYTVKSSRIALLTIIITFTFDLFPHLISTIAYQIFQFNLGDYAGPYSSVIGSVECAICASFYRNTFKVGRLVGQTTSSNPQLATISPNTHNTRFTLPSVR
uniref:Serpentine receptor class gamma n=1 Tax=Panagrellus redivivus TaxID=6233 RepID=A0A7E4VYR6_PANRE